MSCVINFGAAAGNCPFRDDEMPLKPAWKFGGFPIAIF
jgi:hypothetical protein